MNKFEISGSGRGNAVRAWLETLPRPVEPDVMLWFFKTFATRETQYRQNLLSTEANPFAGLEGSPTMDVLASALPALHKAALQRRQRVLQLGIRRVLGEQVDLAAEFAAEIADALRTRSPKPPEEPEATQ